MIKNKNILYKKKVDETGGVLMLVLKKLTYKIILSNKKTSYFEELHSTKKKNEALKIFNNLQKELCKTMNIPKTTR